MKFEDRIAQIGDLAISLGYERKDVDAAAVYFKRRFGMECTPGTWVANGFFRAEERTQAVQESHLNRKPKQLQEHQAAKTAKHCAELLGSSSVHTKRIARAIQMAFDETQFFERSARNIMKTPAQSGGVEESQ